MQQRDFGVCSLELQALMAVLGLCMHSGGFRKGGRFNLCTFNAKFHVTSIPSAYVCVRTAMIFLTLATLGSGILTVLD